MTASHTTEGLTAARDAVIRRMLTTLDMGKKGRLGMLAWRLWGRRRFDDLNVLASELNWCIARRAGGR